MIKFKEFRKISKNKPKSDVPVKSGGKSAGHQDAKSLNPIQAKHIAIEIGGENIIPKQFVGNYSLLLNRLSVSKDTKRKDMPVIDWTQIEGFREFLKKNKIKSVYKSQEVGNLNPIQGQIYFDNVINSLVRHGKPSAGSEHTRKTMIVSSDNYIIDGHHRWASMIITDPTLKVRTLVVNLPIETLLDIALKYGDSIGNIRNEEYLPCIT